MGGSEGGKRQGETEVKYHGEAAQTEAASRSLPKGSQSEVGDKAEASEGIYVNSRKAGATLGKRRPGAGARHGRLKSTGSNLGDEKTRAEGVRMLSEGQDVRRAKPHGRAHEPLLGRGGEPTRRRSETGRASGAGALRSLKKIHIVQISLISL